MSPISPRPAKRRPQPFSGWLPPVLLQEIPRPAATGACHRCLRWPAAAPGRQAPSPGTCFPDHPQQRPKCIASRSTPSTGAQSTHDRPAARRSAPHVPAGTIKIHVSRILAKLDLRDRVQAVVPADKSALIVPERDQFLIFEGKEAATMLRHFGGLCVRHSYYDALAAGKRKAHAQVGHSWKCPREMRPWLL